MKIRQTRSPESYVYCTLSPFTVWVIKKRQRTAAVVVTEKRLTTWKPDVGKNLQYFPILTAEDLIRENFSSCYFDCGVNIRRCIVSTGSE